MDAFEIAQLMTGRPTQRPLKMRFGTVTALDSDTTLSVRPDGQEETVPVVRCCHPNVRDRVALLVNETEWLAISVVGGDRPTEGYAPTNHKHAATDITSGTLPVARGGTGVTTKEAIGLLAYPIGAVYISYVSTSPASLFGGTWTAITGRFPYFNAGTATGGSNTHTLTVAQMPSHTHNYGNYFTQRYDWVSNGVQQIASGVDDRVSGLEATGGGQAHNNMPAYQTLYAWRRTA